MHDRFNRTIDYLRISVTSRCNLSCAYCVPGGEYTAAASNNDLTFQEIEDIAATAVRDFGFTKIRLTGGEPLLRRDIVFLVSMIGNIKGIKDFSLTTNGALLAPYANKLKLAGLQRVNVSLDTVNPERYSELTGGGHIDTVLSGIAAACKVGFSPIKLNCVVEENADEPDAKGVASFAYQHHLEVRYIKKMDLKQGIFRAVTGGTGGDCPKCNRLRLSSDGFVYPCLFNDVRFSLRELGAHTAIKRAIEAKPERGLSSNENRFYKIGG